MNLLGFDTATAATSVCLLRADGEAFEILPPSPVPAGPPGHARELLPGIHAVLEQGGIGFEDLQGIAVGVGPGTFTGLRIGIATARALAEAQGLNLRPVSSLAALAAGIDAPLRLAVIDARRRELFAALHGAQNEPVWPPFVATPDALAERVAAAGLNPRAAGDGSLRFRERFEAAGIEVSADADPAHVVRALHVCRLATTVPETPSEAVLPDYLRLPDVDIQP